MRLEPRTLIRHSAVPLACALDLLLAWDKTSLPAVGGPALLVGLTGIVALPLAFRDSAPVGALLAVICGTLAVAVAVPGFVPVFSTWIALFAVSMRCRRAVAIAALVASFGTLAVNAATEVASHNSGAGSASQPGILASAIMAGVLIHSAVFGLGRWVKWSIDQRRLVAALAAREASARECSRIARDLHDIVAHSISLMVIHAGAAGKSLTIHPDRAAESMQHVAELGEQAVGELRQMLGLLHDEAQQNVSGQAVREQGVSSRTFTHDAAPSTPARARKLVSEAAVAGLAIDFSVQGSPIRLAPETDDACYRVIQEAVTNALKHGGGGAASLTLMWQPDGVCFELVNQVGEPGAAGGLSTGHGLAGMTARAATAGGLVEAGSVGGDFRVHARFPSGTPELQPAPS